MIPSGFPLDSGDDTGRFVGEGFDPGVIAGVGVAGVIVVIALILLAIYCCMRSRNGGTKEQHAGNAYNESSVYTSGIVNVMLYHACFFLLLWYIGVTN